jgi:dipeptidyl aminopeptidase/acylaminoacyl peptidase
MYMADFTWTPDRLIHYPLVEHVDLAPDGQSVLVAVRSPYLSDDASEFRTQVYRAQTGEGPPVQLTFGDSASQPRYSPDGRLIAFLRKTPGANGAGLWLMPSDGGEAWPLTGPANGVRNAIAKFCWSPDGRAIAFIAVPWDDEQDARRRRRDDAIHWRVDYDFAHLFVLNLNAATAGGALPPVRQITRGRLHVNSFSWTIDSRRIVLTHQETPLLDAFMTARLSIVDVNDYYPSPRLLDRVGANGAGPYCSPDGRWIACAHAPRENHWPFAARIYLYPFDGGPILPLAHVSDEQPVIAGWTPDSSALYVVNQQGIGSEIAALPVGGGSPVPVVAPTRLISAWSTNSSGQLALVMQNFDESNAVYTAEPAGATASVEPRLVYRPTTAEFPDGPLPRVQLLQWRTPDGFDIEGILYLPTGAGERKLPLLLHIHGGPASIFQRQFAAVPYYYTPAALCERGIAVLRCNPRGSGGYGRAFRFANMRDWGGGDYRDLQQGVDTVLDMGIADPERLGVCGWSYGGYMTSWTITQTHRFRAASIGAPVTSPMTFCATADIPSFVPDYFGGESWENFERYRNRSPIFHAHKARTPSIIQHGDADERVPLEQGLQFYYILQRCGAPVEMYIYPRQGHAISEPRLLADAAQRNLDWFTRMLL